MSKSYKPKSLRCPKCGQDCDFQVVCYGKMTAYLDGEGSVAEVDNAHPEILPDSFCQCPECQHFDSLRQFEVAG